MTATIDRRRPDCTVSGVSNQSLTQPRPTPKTDASANGTAVSMPAFMTLKPFACCK
jgi:hypothetical protein